MGRKGMYGTGHNDSYIPTTPLSETMAREKASTRLKGGSKQHFLWAHGQPVFKAEQIGMHISKSKAGSSCHVLLLLPQTFPPTSFPCSLAAAPFSWSCSICGAFSKFSIPTWAVLREGQFGGSHWWAHLPSSGIKRCSQCNEFHLWLSSAF